MSEQSVFTQLDAAQLHYLKAQYIATLQLLEQTEATLKQQLEDVQKARKQVDDQMSQLDRHLETPAAKPAPQRKTTARSTRARSSRPS
jgi:cell division protein FtsB